MEEVNPPSTEANTPSPIHTHTHLYTHTLSQLPLASSISVHFAPEALKSAGERGRHYKKNRPAPRCAGLRCVVERMGWATLGLAPCNGFSSRAAGRAVCPAGGVRGGWG